MKIIADTNIIISALISPKGKESDIILNPYAGFKKFSRRQRFLKAQFESAKKRGISETIVETILQNPGEIVNEYWDK
jgi:hypothetical protein